MTYDNSFCTVRYSLRDFFGHALPMHWANVLTVLAEEYVGVYLGDRREFGNYACEVGRGERWLHSPSAIINPTRDGPTSAYDSNPG